MRALLLCWLATSLQGQSAKVVFPPVLAAWKSEISQSRRVIAARIYIDAARNEFILPDDAEQRSAVASLLRSESVTAQLVNAYALTINLDRGSSRASFILINMKRAEDWEGEESALLAHELGHIWLHSNGYQGADARGGCEDVHRHDLVQHVLIRSEAARRGVALEPYLVRTFQAAYEAMKSGAARPDPSDMCKRTAALSLLMDVRATNWEHSGDFESLLEDRFPGLLKVADTLRRELTLDHLSTPKSYTQAVLRVASATKASTLINH